MFTKRDYKSFANLFMIRLHRKIKTSYIHDIKREGDMISFSAPPARHIWNGWNVFNTISKARFYLDMTGKYPLLHFKLNFLEIFVTAFLISLSSFTAFYQESYWLGGGIIALSWAAYIIARFVTVRRVEKLADKLRYEINNPDKSYPSLAAHLTEDIAFAKQIFGKK